VVQTRAGALYRQRANYFTGRHEHQINRWQFLLPEFLTSRFVISHRLSP